MAVAPSDSALASPGEPAARRRRRVTTAAVLLGLVVAAFEGTVVTSAMPTIAADLGGLALYPWVFSAFLLASTASVLVCGKLADGFGRRPVFAAGMGLFLVGSALCGAAPSMPALIAFRVIQGLGAGAIQPIAMTVTADIYTLEERARIQGVLTSAWGGANVLGPVIGGFIVTHASWRWVFFVNVPFGLLATGLLLASYRDRPRAPGGPLGGLGGALLAGAAAAVLLLALEPPAGIGGAARLALLGVAAGGVALFVRQQRRAAEPLLAPGVLSSRVVRAGLAGGLFAGGLLYTAAAHIPLWMTLHGSGPLLAGAALVPMLAGWAIGSSFGVRVLVQRGMRASVVGGYAIAFAGAVGLALAGTLRLPLGFVLAALGLMGLGLGPAASTALVAAQNSVAWQHRGAVTSAVYASRMLGGSIAVAGMAALPEGLAGPGTDFVATAGIALGAVALLSIITPDRAGERERAAP